MEWKSHLFETHLYPTEFEMVLAVFFMVVSCSKNEVICVEIASKRIERKQRCKRLNLGPVRESNPGPLAPKARIMPLDQQADVMILKFIF